MISHFLSVLYRVNKERLVLIPCPPAFVSVPDLVSVTKPLIGLKKLPGKREYCGRWNSNGQVMLSGVNEFVPFFPNLFLQIWGKLDIVDLQLMLLTLILLMWRIG
jgi:hypothetical protein